MASRLKDSSNFRRNDNDQVRIVMTTYPDEEAAAKVARELVDRGYCACANLLRLRSIFSWKGELNDCAEVAVLFKTSRRASSPLKQEIARSHPYQVPEILEIGTKSASKSYSDWVLDSTKGITQSSHNTSKRRHSHSDVS